MENAPIQEVDWTSFWLRFKDGGTPATTYVHPRLLDMVDGCHVLDLGCGYGRTAMDMASRAAHVVGVDINAAEIDYAQRKNKQENVTFKVMDGARCELPSESFDVLTLFGVLGGVQKKVRDDILQESMRLLRPGGMLYISEHTIHDESPYAAAEYEDGLRVTGEPGSLILRESRDMTADIVLIAKHFTPEEMEAELADHGFQDVVIDTPRIIKHSFTEPGTTFEREMLCAFATKSTEG